MTKKFTDLNVFQKSVAQETAGLEFGFYWKNIDQILEQIKSECAEVKEAFLENDSAHLKEEVGDLISATICLSIFLKLDPEVVLQESVAKYQQRYNKLVELVREDGLTDLKNQPVEVLMKYWNKAKGVKT